MISSERADFFFFYFCVGNMFYTGHLPETREKAINDREQANLCVVLCLKHAIFLNHIVCRYNVSLRL